MESVKQVTKKYNELIQDVAKNEFYKIDLTNRVNCYVCDCGHVTKTKDVDAGVTPFFFTCESCNSIEAKSTFFNDITPQQKPTFEWYRPSLKEVLKIRDEFLLDHILQGGLDHRKIITT